MKQIAKRNKEVRINGGDKEDKYKDPRGKDNYEEIKSKSDFEEKQQHPKENEYDLPYHNTGTRPKTNTNMGKEIQREEYKKQMDEKMLQHHGYYEPTETKIEQHNFLEENMYMDQYNLNVMKPTYQPRDLPLEPEKKLH